MIHYINSNCRYNHTYTRQHHTYKTLATANEKVYNKLNMANVKDCLKVALNFLVASWQMYKKFAM